MSGYAALCLVLGLCAMIVAVFFRRGGTKRDSIGFALAVIFFCSCVVCRVYGYSNGDTQGNRDHAFVECHRKGFADVGIDKSAWEVVWYCVDEKGGYHQLTE